MSAAGTMYIIDAHALIFQMFHAIQELNAPDGRPMNAVFGVTRDLIWLHQEVQPEYLLCAFDRAEPTFRDAIYPEYKKHRPPPPPDLLAQEPNIHQVLEAMNLPVLSLAGFEADDLMATLAKKGEERGLDVFICTSDKDCRQLISDHVKIYNLRKREIVDRDALMKIWSITPEQVVDFQSLLGDSVDNVPGVPGIGEKTAAKLLQQYGTLDNLVAHANEIKQPKMRENLKKAIETGDLKRSRDLVRLDVNVPMEINWEGWRRRDWNGPRLLELMQEFGFRSFGNQVRASLKGEGQAKDTALVETVNESNRPKARPKLPAEPDLFSSLDENIADAAAPLPDRWNASYVLVDTPEAWGDFLADLRKCRRFAIDLETTGLDPLRAEIVGYAFSWQAGTGWYVPVKAPAGEKHLDYQATSQQLKPIFADPTIAKVNQNIKYDSLVLAAHGIALRGIGGDSMIAHYLLEPGARAHGLDDLTQTYFGHTNITITELIGKGKTQKTMDQVPTARVCAYAAEDADAAWRLCERLEPEVEQEGLKKLYDDLEIALIEVLADMEFNGIRLDVPFLKQLSGEMESQIERIEKQIHEAAERKFNIGSPKQLREVLFDQLGLPKQRRTGQTNEPSTDQDTLEKLARLSIEKYPQAQVAVAIVEHRQVSKLKGTYVDALPLLVNPKTGRIHTSFNQTVAETGRLSSSDPNLQNIPIKTTQGQQIRKAFLPREGWKLLSADYSQVELRLLAHFCKDPTLCAAFAQDQDIHAAVAAEIYKVPLKEVSSEQRRMAKTVNFGVIYGMSAFGLSEALTISRSEAEAFIDMYFARYPNVLKYQDDLLRACRNCGFVSTILGRRRKFNQGEISERPSYRSRKAIDRQAINMEIQGSAADLMKLALLNVHRRLRDEKRQAKMLLTVHDELVFEAPPEEVKDVAHLVREEMIGAMKLDVPLKVDVSVGENWLETEEVVQ